MPNSVRSGCLDPANIASTGAFRRAGQEGFWWLSLGADNVWGETGLGGYRLYISDATVNTSNGPNDRAVGFSLRCLSTVLDM